MLPKDKVCVVTGAASGIGEAVARAFAAGGARGVVVADTNAEAAAKLAADIGGLAVPTDVGREADIKALIARAEERFGPVDVFYSNAGVSRPGMEDSSDEIWDLNWRVHVMSHLARYKDVGLVIYDQIDLTADAAENEIQRRAVAIASLSHGAAERYATFSPRADRLEVCYRPALPADLAEDVTAAPEALAPRILAAHVAGRRLASSGPIGDNRELSCSTAHVFWVAGCPLQAIRLEEKDQ